MEEKQVIEGKYTDVQVYDMLKMAGCPIRLPVSRSMTQAKIDFEHIKNRVIQWYNTQSK